MVESFHDNPALTEGKRIFASWRFVLFQNHLFRQAFYKKTGGGLYIIGSEDAEPDCIGKIYQKKGSYIKMRKILALFLAVVMLCSFAACGNNNGFRSGGGGGGSPTRPGDRIGNIYENGHMRFLGKHKVKLGVLVIGIQYLMLSY